MKVLVIKKVLLVIHENNLTANENALKVRTLERCFIEKIETEISNIADTLEDRKNAILTAY